ncbi:MAG: ribosomal L7Ae/L30e/S12e/Gadd45 family protein [Peptococcaceae bacterium]|jgi:ribosomal protein L7Ae-like RNA K-turn-binding protein|nr:ribosomal L7Ae/L30e/S12e/Gadd45 family protein [Peptococcaceae bacterium]MDH7524084.1 ribosomal L7Ae/L30e/S12e/Gadd45 family protein [Peptococcaceae bacterium]
MMSLPLNIASLLGFARKSGQLLTGRSAVQAGLKKREARLVIVAKDLPEKRKLYWKKRCEQSGSQYMETGTKEELGKLLGVRERGVLAVKGKQISEAINKKVMQSGQAEDN